MRLKPQFPPSSVDLRSRSFCDNNSCIMSACSEINNRLMTGADAERIEILLKEIEKRVAAAREMFDATALRLYP